MTGGPTKIDWSGDVLAAQPRIRLTRSFDQSSHTYLGYRFRVRGRLANHQGIGNRPIDSSLDESPRSGEIERHERLGGLLRYYRRAA